MTKEEVEKLMREAKILYWKEDDKVLYQQNHIGKPDNLNKSENIDEPLGIE